jgi:Putative beta-barrel porin-2, OmpL-like. bbp2
VLKTFRTWLAAALLAPLAALAQTTPAAPAPAAAEQAKPPPKWYDTVEIHGLVDTYYSANVDQAQASPNELRVFDALNGFQLSYAKVWAQLAPTTPFTAGFRFDLGLGQTAAILNGSSTYGLGVGSLASGGPSSGIGAVALQQAYGSLKLPFDVVVDGGKFVTNAGAEVIEAKDNWLYSRSLLFGFAIPFTHTGVRATVPIPGVEGLSLMAGLFNGFDDPPGPVGSSKVGHVALVYSGPSSTTGVVNLFYGKPLPGQQDKTLVDVVLARAFGDLSLNVNFDYGDQNGISYWGIAGMARYSLLGDKLRISARGEYLNDDDGLIFAASNKYYEGTLGLSIPVGSQVELRLEGRHDRMKTAAFATGKDNQTTLQVAALAWF